MLNDELLDEAARLQLDHDKVHAAGERDLHRDPLAAIKASRVM